MPAEDRYMVSVVIAIVTTCDVMLINVRAVPIGYATELFAGIVYVLALASPDGWKMCLPASARTSVYAALWLFCGMFLKPTSFVPSTVQDDKMPDAGVPSAGVVSVGDVSVLFVSVSLPASVASVPVVGSVTPVVPVTVSVVAKAPLIVSVDAALLATPVPPFAGASVPASVIVPLPVIGPPLVVRPVVPPDTATLVTVPLVAGEAQLGAPPVVAVST